MPKVLRIDGYRFFNEGNKPIHIHIESGDGYCKFWLEPISLTYSKGYYSSELNKIRKIVDNNSQQLNKSWNEYFSEK